MSPMGASRGYFVDTPGILSAGCVFQHIPANFPGVRQGQKEKSSTCSWQLGLHPRCNNMTK